MTSVVTDVHLVLEDETQDASHETPVSFLPPSISHSWTHSRDMEVDLRVNCRSMSPSVSPRVGEGGGRQEFLREAVTGRVPHKAWSIERPGFVTRRDASRIETLSWALSHG